MLKRLLGSLPLIFLRRHAEREKNNNYLEKAHRLANVGDHAGAWAACQAARSLGGESADLLALEGGLLGMRGEYEEARRLLERVLIFSPEHAQANADLGNIALAQGRLEEAARQMDVALRQMPDNISVLCNRAQVERARENWQEAERILQRAIKLDPENRTAVEKLFSVYDESERYTDALALADRMLQTDPGSAHWLHMRGFLMYKRLFESRNADALFDLAEQAGQTSAAFWVDRGICARDLGEAERAGKYLALAHELEPENPLPIFHNGLLRLYEQRYAEGWDAYEVRLDDQHWLGAPLPAPRWDGENLNGRPLLVMAEQGLGDEIMFSSCLDDLPDSSPIYADCAEKLLSIFRASFPQITWLAKGGLPAIASKYADCMAIPMGSLPQLYRRSIEQFPRKTYLTAPVDASELAKQRLGDLSGLKVGISWRGGTEITRKRLRSLPLAVVGRLAGVGGIEWVNLQYGDCSEELAGLREQYGLFIHHWPELLEPYEMTAALVQQLDLVISVDTTVVHLAGALGQRVWALVPHVPEWRYGFSTREMPWYARVEIMRQPVAGNWDAPMDEVIARLEKYSRPLG